MLQITDLHVTTDNKEILKGLNLTLKTGEFAALMGPNGSGKSTLAGTLAGHPAYSVTSGTVTLDGTDLLALRPEERAARGLFLAFQYPASIPGVSVSSFLRLALNAQEKANGKPLTALAPFLNELKKQMRELEMPWEFAQRAVNDGFSGGEKKRLEMLQMLVLRPRLVILDEVDSGLDIDAMRLVAKAVNSLDRTQTAVLIITHYQRLLDYLTPDSVHIMRDGSIVTSGGAELAKHLETHGYKEDI